MPRSRRRRLRRISRIKRRRGGSIVGLIATAIPTALSFANNILRKGTSWGVMQDVSERMAKHNHRHY